MKLHAQFTNVVKAWIVSGAAIAGERTRVHESIQKLKGRGGRVNLCSFTNGHIEHAAGVRHIDAINLFAIDNAQAVGAGDFKAEADVVILQRSSVALKNAALIC